MKNKTKYIVYYKKPFSDKKSKIKVEAYNVDSAFALIPKCKRNGQIICGISLDE